MALLDLIKHRRSIRDFLDKPVEREKIMKCLEAARLAPSACNAQPWRFIVVDDEEVKDKLCVAIFGGIYSLNSFCQKAPVIVVIISERRRFSTATSRFLSAIGGTLRRTKYYLIDIGIAGEHFILQAEELGLGTCWIGWFNEGAVKRILNIPRHKKIDTLIALGYYHEKKSPAGHKRRPVNGIVSFNSY